MNRRGFSLIELMIVVSIMGILASIALPAYQHARRQADAAHLIADFNSIRLAAYNQFTTQGTYPASTGWGVVPAVFAPTLGAGFPFEYKTVDYRWMRWGDPQGNRGGNLPRFGLEFRTNDKALLAVVRSKFGGMATGSGNRLTLIME